MKSKESQSKIMIVELIKKVFEKAGNESGEDKPYGLSKHLEEKFENTGVRLKLLTFERYYSGYIKNGKKYKPNAETKDALSKYLGYIDFLDFCNKNKCYAEKRWYIRMLRWSILANVVLLILLAIYIKKSSEENCMIWVNDHYEKTKCSGAEYEKPLDKEVLKNFTKIEACKDTTFFVDGEAIIHYTRYNNNIDFFTDDGEHPIYEGVYTDPITRTIINSRVQPCDSVKIN